MVFHTGSVAMQEGFYFWSASDTEWNLLYSGSVPSVPGNTVYWVRPTGMNYIQPEGNDYIRINDAGETHGIYYDGSTNQYGIFSRTTDGSGTTSAVVGFSDVTGNQTYGYLGYNGLYSSGTGFGDVDGMAVYGMVNDPDRAAGFFRTTGSASMASLQSYSNVWSASFNFVDNLRSNYNPVCGYFELVNSLDPNGNVYQNAFMTLSQSTCPGNVGKTSGGYIQAFGGNQDSYGLFGIGSSTNLGLGVYASGSSLGLYSSSGGGYKGQNYGIGVLSNGDLFGGLFKGNVYGLHVSGSEYAAYYDGIQYSNNISVQLVDNGADVRTTVFVPVSETVDVILKGQGELVNGKAVITFASDMALMISETEPIYITITPTSATQGIYINSSKSTGFEVVENNNGKSSATFNWIAIATRKGYENVNIDKAVLANDFDDNFSRVYLDFDKKQNSSSEIMWDGDKMIFGKIPFSVKQQKDAYMKSKYYKDQDNNQTQN